jgi:DNA-binding transcriptional LysR family regulator
LPRLLAVLEAEAPLVQVYVRPLPLDPEEALASGDIDAMIGVYAGTLTTMYRRVAFSETTAVLARRGHPLVHRGKLTLDDYLAASHILIAPRGQPTSRIDRLLAERDRRRRIASLVPEFLVAPFIVSETDLLLTAGERLLRSFVDQLPVQVIALPFEVPAFDVHLVWHARLHEDAAFAWFREQIIAVHEQVYRKA